MNPKLNAPAIASIFYPFGCPYAFFNLYVDLESRTFSKQQSRFLAAKYNLCIIFFLFMLPPYFR